VTDGWLLYTQQAVAADGGRGLGSGRFFTSDGTHLATVAQEGMIRAAGLHTSRPLSEGGPA
jgi:acyl-CoA thioesterase-2